MTNALDWLDEALHDTDRRDLRRTPIVRSSRPSADTLVSQGKTLINFGSNDYLGLAPIIGGKIIESISRIGWGAGASPLVTGKTTSHEALRTRTRRVEANRGRDSVFIGIRGKCRDDSRTRWSRRCDLQRCQEPCQYYRRLPTLRRGSTGIQASRPARSEGAARSLPIKNPSLDCYRFGFQHGW